MKLETFENLIARVLSLLDLFRDSLPGRANYKVNFILYDSKLMMYEKPSPRGIC